MTWKAELLNGKTVTILPTGSCFDDCVEYVNAQALEANSYEELVKTVNSLHIVHGIVWPKKHPRRYSHAWVEHKDDVWNAGIIDGKKVFMQIAKLEFYREMRVEKSTTYTISECLELEKSTGRFGPWEDEYLKLCADWIAESGRENLDE